MRVGTRIVFYVRYKTIRDHPHACGDKDYKSALTYPATGSSPCVWGQAVSDIVTVPFSRIIPMRVGTRSCRSRAVS